MLSDFAKGIKPKHPKTTRQTLAKQIRLLATQDTHAAQMLAERGRVYDDFEKQLTLYYREIQEMMKMQSGQKTTYEEILDGLGLVKEKEVALNRQVIKTLVERDRVRLCQIFIAAVDAQDSKSLIAIAKTIERLKTNKGVADRYRSEILMWKGILEKRNRGMTIKELARVIDWPRKFSDDGFAQLRRMCRELNFPIAASRRIRRN